jgi:hypothetical protein
LLFLACGSGLGRPSLPKGPLELSLEFYPRYT